MFYKNKRLYRITLYPYRSLNKTGFFLLMFVLGLFSFIAGIMFMLKGAWPVFGFFGLDVLLVYIFFKINKFCRKNRKNLFRDQKIFGGKSMEKSMKN